MLFIISMMNLLSNDKFVHKKYKNLRKGKTDITWNGNRKKSFWWLRVFKENYVVSEIIKVYGLKQSHLWKHFLKLNSIKLSPLLKKVIKVCVLYFYIFLQKVARKKLWKKILKTVFIHKILTFSRVLIPLFPQSAIAELMNLVEDKS